MRSIEYTKTAMVSVPPSPHFFSIFLPPLCIKPSRVLPHAPGAASYSGRNSRGRSGFIQPFRLREALSQFMYKVRGAFKPRTWQLLDARFNSYSFDVSPAAPRPSTTRGYNSAAKIKPECPMVDNISCGSSSHVPCIRANFIARFSAFFAEQDSWA